LGWRDQRPANRKYARNAAGIERGMDQTPQREIYVPAAVSLSRVTFNEKGRSIGGVD